MAPEPHPGESACVRDAPPPRQRRFHLRGAAAEPAAVDRVGPAAAALAAGQLLAGRDPGAGGGRGGDGERGSRLSEGRDRDKAMRSLWRALLALALLVPSTSSA